MEETINVPLISTVRKATLERYYEKYRNEKIDCPCGSIISHFSLYDHNHSKKHIEWEKTQQTLTQAKTEKAEKIQEKSRIQSRKYYSENREKNMEKTKEWIRNNRDKVNEKKRQYAQRMTNCQRCGKQMTQSQLRYHNFAHKNCNQPKSQK